MNSDAPGFNPAIASFEDLPPDGGKPPELLQQQWELIDFLATPPDLRDLEWESEKKNGRPRTITTERWCKRFNVRSQTTSKWRSNPWFRHYLTLVRDQRAMYDQMTEAALDAMYFVGTETGDQRQLKAWLDYKERYTHEPKQTGPATGVAGTPAEMSDEALDALLDD